VVTISLKEIIEIENVKKKKIAVIFIYLIFKKKTLNLFLLNNILEIIITVT